MLLYCGAPDAPSPTVSRWYGLPLSARVRRFCCCVTPDAQSQRALALWPFAVPSAAIGGTGYRFSSRRPFVRRYCRISVRKRMARLRSSWASSSVASVHAS